MSLGNDAASQPGGPAGPGRDAEAERESGLNEAPGAGFVVRIRKLHADARLPWYEHPGDAGADLCSVVDCSLAPLARAAIPTGLSAEVPPGYELQVRPKSGLALRHGITVLNTPGTVDAGYRGEIKVILINLGDVPYQVRKGEKIAQLVVAPVVRATFVETQRLSETERGAGGFGSTGKS